MTHPPAKTHPAVRPVTNTAMAGLVASQAQVLVRGISDARTHMWHAMECARSAATNGVDLADSPYPALQARLEEAVRDVDALLAEAHAANDAFRKNPVYVAYFQESYGCDPVPGVGL